MKKFLLSLFGLVGMCSLSAKSYMYVDLKDSTVKYDANDVLEVIFEEKIVGADKTGVSVSGTHVGYEYVDLGLESGIMWATCSVGATKPEERGHFYAWGHTEPLEHYIDFSYSEYKFLKNMEGTEYYYYTKYVIDDAYAYSGKADNLVNLLSEDDAASVNLGGNWRMPTKEEFDELKGICTWKSVEDFNGTGVFGLLGTSTVNGNTLFFPSVAPYYEGADTHLYWSSSLSSHSANALGIGVVYNKYKQNLFNDMDVNRLDAGSVRAVFPKSVSKSKIYMIVHLVNGDAKSYLLDDILDVRFDVEAEKHTVQFFDKEGSLLDSQEVEDGADAIAPDTPIVCNFKFLGWNESFTNVKSDLIVNAMYEEVINEVDGHEYVDLGLPSGTKWAKYDIGATESNLIGNWLAWRANEGCGDDLQLDMDSKLALQEKGVVDSEGNLTPSYDAATQLWGENWKTPTGDDFQELFDYCDWKWVTYNGEKGYMVSSKSGCSECGCIFIPTLLLMLDDYAQVGLYHTATFQNSFPIAAVILKDSKYICESDRRCLFIRPVLKQKD